MSRASSIDLTTTKKELFSSVEDGIYVLGKPHRPSIPSLVSVHIAAFMQDAKTLTLQIQTFNCFKL